VKLDLWTVTSSEADALSVAIPASAVPLLGCATAVVGGILSKPNAESPTS
jgi:hypothetical protein